MDLGSALHITPDNANNILDSLRWHDDMIIVNPFGERVWLKVCYDNKGKRLGVTDCCSTSYPCEWHQTLTHLGITRLRPK